MVDLLELILCMLSFLGYLVELINFSIQILVGSEVVKILLQLLTLFSVSVHNSFSYFLII